MLSNRCKFIPENKNKQKINHNRGIDFRNKNKSNANKRRRLNNNEQFENISTEIINDDVGILNPINDVTTTLEEVVAQLNTLIEKKKFKNKIITIIITLMGTIIEITKLGCNKTLINIIPMTTIRIVKLIRVIKLTMSIII